MKKTIILFILLIGLLVGLSMSNLPIEASNHILNLSSSEIQAYLGSRLQYTTLDGGFPVFSIVPPPNLPMDRAVFALYMRGNDISSNYERILFSAIALPNGEKYYHVKVDAAGDGELHAIKYFFRDIPTPVLGLYPNGTVLINGKRVLTEP